MTNLSTGNFIDFKSSRIHYIKFGDAPRFLFAFHGFGENAANFIKLQPALSTSYTVIAIDFPKHGHTQWVEDEHICPEDLADIVNSLMTHLGITRTALLGFSMGGRMVLSLTSLLSQKIDRIILLASDGIKTHLLFNIAVYPAWGRKLFAYVMHHPGFFLSVVKGLRNLRLISRFLHDFTMNQMGSAAKRLLILDTWLAISRFNPSKKDIVQSINTHAIETIMIFGERDKVIKSGSGKKLCRKLNNCHYHIVPKGHFMVSQSFNEELAKIL